MQAKDNLDGSADAEFGSPGAGAVRSGGTCSETGMATEREFPRENGPARSAIGLLNGPQGSSPPESSSKQSELRESRMLECKRNRPQRGSAMKSSDHGPAIVSDQLWSSIECRSDEQVAQPRGNSEAQLPADGCDERGKSPVGDIDTQSTPAEKAKIDECSEVFATASSVAADLGTGTESVKKKRGGSRTANRRALAMHALRSGTNLKNHLQMKGPAN